MKSKILSLTFIALFLVAFVGALTLSIGTSPATLSGSNNSTTLKINADNNTDFTFPSTLIITDKDNHQVLLKITNITSAINVTSTTLKLDLDSVDSNFNFGTYSKDLTISATGDSINVPVEYEQDFCEAGNQGDLRLKTDIQNIEGFGQDDDEWYLFDEIEVTIDVENRGNDDIEDVIVEWGLYNQRTGELLFDDEDDLRDLDDGDEETIDFTFIVDADEFDESDNEDDFTFLVRAYSEDNEDMDCKSDQTDIRIIRDDHFVIFSNLQIPETVQCKETLSIRGDVWNIGDDDEDEVSVLITSSDFNIEEKIEIGDMDVLDDDSFTFEYQVPEDLEEGNYRITIQVLDEDDNVFENDEDDESRITRIIRVEGNCDSESAAITATPESDSIAGQEMTIRATITNTGLSQTSYQMFLNGHNSWATLNSITPGTFTLSADESQDVTIRLTPNSNIEGEQEFTIQAVYNGQVTETKVIIPVAPKESFFPSLTGFSIADNIKENWFIWLIVLVNIILVILIIVAAVRLMRRE